MTDKGDLDIKWGTQQPDRNEDFDWETAGLLTTTTDMQVISAGTLAFKEAWQNRFSADQDVDLAPPFELVQKFSFVGKGFDHKKADLYDIRLLIQPIKRSETSVEEVKRFTGEVYEILRAKTEFLKK